MGAGEIIAIVVIALIVVGAMFYIIKAKKSGRKCIGCPDGCYCNKKNKCQGSCGGNCGCDKSNNDISEEVGD